MSTPIPRGWAPYRRAAREYVGISEDILLGAIKRHELKAYDKPPKTPRPGVPRENHSYYVCLADVDEYIRKHWPEYA